ncbi:hypothetical protein T265_05099 [Opisthorchis viverrini]|uniref:Uncharacterized protein n=1 Tax=Opisthorchis viverrini TaxID=6198 RepID=A0A074ZQ75_OPIVI|nr:hypothetical protein T265_05099 [Opisthorchis viverrini]KER27977.1 hypothetical protein T265_05099 [Opisthorchis viverrini]
MTARTPLTSMGDHFLQRLQPSTNGITTIRIETDNMIATDIGRQPYLVVSPTRHSEDHAVPTTNNMISPHHLPVEYLLSISPLDLFFE